jgi:hypothetical protein
MVPALGTLVEKFRVWRADRSQRFDYGVSPTLGFVISERHGNADVGLALDLIESRLLDWAPGEWEVTDPFSSLVPLPGHRLLEKYILHSGASSWQTELGEWVVDQLLDFAGSRTESVIVWFGVENAEFDKDIALERGLRLRRLSPAEKAAYQSRSSGLHRVWYGDLAGWIVECRVRTGRGFREVVGGGILKARQLSEAVHSAIQLHTDHQVALIELEHRSVNIFSSVRPTMMDRRAPVIVDWGGPAIRSVAVKSGWPSIKQIAGHVNHPLAEPLQRLALASTKERARDSLLDLAIGLEPLFAGGRRHIRDTFIRNGTRILSQSAPGRDWASTLAELRDVRNDLVHGKANAKRSEAELRAMVTAARQALRLGLAAKMGLTPTV